MKPTQRHSVLLSAVTDKDPWYARLRSLDPHRCSVGVAMDLLGELEGGRRKPRGRLSLTKDAADGMIPLMVVVFLICTSMIIVILRR